MGFIPTLLGLGGNGANFQAQQANIQSPTTVQQANDAYALAQQQAQQQAQFAQQTGAVNGLGNQQNVYNQLQQVAQGQGPNPAQAELAQATGQNIASQAALAAGQRGAGANAGLIARQVGQQGGALQQQAAGQAATLQAQQSLGALNQLGGIAGQQVGQQQNALATANQAAQGLQGNVLQGISNQNNANVQMQGNVNSANAGVAQQNAKKQGDILSSLAGAAGTVLGLASGGAVPNGPKSHVTHYLNNYKDGGKVSGKPAVKGDSPKNDTVPAMLSPGEIVVPRTAAKDPKKAAAFARQVAMRGKK